MAFCLTTLTKINEHVAIAKVSNRIGKVNSGIVGVGVGPEVDVGFGVDVDVGVGVGVGVVDVGVGVGVGVDVGGVEIGDTMVLDCKVTAVCANALPFNVAPVVSAIAVLSRIIPLKAECVPSVVCPATTQKMLLACAPPLKITCTLELTVRVPAIWNTHSSLELPERVTADGIITLVLHL
jgi:hypothetical protein